MAFKDKETELAYRRTYYFRNRDRLRKQKRAEYRRNYLKYAQRARRKLLSEEQREKVYIYNKNWIKKNQRKLRLQCIYYYSNGKNSCKCCGESHTEFLAIDHENGGGSKHRKEIKKKCYSIYSFLIKNNFPKGFRVLCHNCNMSLGFYGYCPHDNDAKFE